MSEAPESYEVAVERLEEIIDRLDSGQAGLRETLDLCKEGRELVTYCAAELDAVGEGLKELRLDELAAKLDASAEPGRLPDQGPSTSALEPGSPASAQLRSSAGATGNSPRPIRAIAASSRSRPASISAGPSRETTGSSGPLEEDVGDLDLRCAAGLGDGERVDRPLGLVAGGVLGRVGAVEAVGLVVDDQRRRALALDQQVDRAAQDRAGDAEQERHLGAAAHPIGADALAEQAGPEPAADRLEQLLGQGPRVGVESRGEGMAARQLRGRLAPPVRLAPLEQGVHGGAVRGPLLPRRGRRRALLAAASPVAASQPEHALHVEAVGAVLVGGDRRVGERPARHHRGAPLHQRRRPLAEWARGARVPPRRGQLGGPLRRGEADADRDLGGREGGVEAVARLRRGTGTVESLSRSISKPSTIRSITGVPGFVSRPACGLDDAAEDQPLARPGRGDVEEPQPLLGVALLRLLAELARRSRG